MVFPVTIIGRLINDVFSVISVIAFVFVRFAFAESGRARHVVPR